MMMIAPTRKWAWAVAAGLMATASASANPYLSSTVPTARHGLALPGEPCPPSGNIPPGSMPLGSMTPPLATDNPNLQQPSPTATESEETAGEALFAGQKTTSYHAANPTMPGTGLTANNAAVTAVVANSTRFVSSTTTSSQLPLILPGLFTAIQTQGAIPLNRLSLDYGYFDAFKARANGTQTGFNLHSFNIGGEYVFLDNLASIYFRVPFLNATQNTTGQKMDGLGDVSFGIKYALWMNSQTGSALSLGLTVALPTAPDLVAVTSTYSYAPNSADRGNTTLPPSQRETINPTFWQPYLSGVYMIDDLALSSYAGLVIPSQSQVTTLANLSLGASYTIYRNPQGWLSSITPGLNAQALIPLNKRDGAPAVPPPLVRRFDDQPLALPPFVAPSVSVNSRDQVFLSPSCQFGLGQSMQFSAAFVIPISGTKAYNVGGTVGLTFFY